MNLNLQGKAAVVTGAAAGIGREVAHAFAREGVRVALVDIDAEGVHREAQALSTEATPCLGLAGDVADRSRVLAMIAAAHSAFGRIDILFNNAGISTRCPMETLPEEDWDRVLAVNGTPLGNAGSLQRLLLDDAIGARVEITVLRNGALVDVVAEPTELVD